MNAGLLIGGKWKDSGARIEVRNKYSGESIAALVAARPEDADAAIDAAGKAAAAMARLPAHRRCDILAAASRLIRERSEEIARTIAAESGKALKYSRIEVDRAIGTFSLASEESRRIHGETVPLDALPAGEGYFGFYVRRPVGVIVAISPFNFPLNLVAHKVAPAIAAGNSVVLKPASSTPMTAVKLCEILQDAGLPPGGINLLIGPGGTIGSQLVEDPRVAMVTFTGSAEVGRQVMARAGIKRVTLELGNTSPVIVAADADLEHAARRCAVGAYYNSGQVCISVQRIYVDRIVHDSFVDRFVRAAEAMVVGDPLDESTDVGPMIDMENAGRIEEWIQEAKAGGARVATGSKREGPVVWPTVLTNVRPEMKVIALEAFGPVASILPFDTFHEAVEQANATHYGLQAGVFTRDMDRVLESIHRLNFGGIIINDAPSYRADHMPYGGVRQSGLGREGIRYAVEEMTNIHLIAIRRSG